MSGAITPTDVLRCNRLRGLSCATCSCRTGPDTPDNHAGWAECPPGAYGIFVGGKASRAYPAPAAPPPKGNDRPLAQYTGDACETCGSMAMVRTGACATCQDCGSSGGCG